MNINAVIHDEDVAALRRKLNDELPMDLMCDGGVADPGGGTFFTYMYYSMSYIALC